MAKLKEEAAALEDRDLAAKVSPHIVLLAFFGKADISGKPDLIEVVIENMQKGGQESIAGTALWVLCTIDF